MARALRIELEGGIHHVTMRGNRRQAIFLDDRDRYFLLTELGVTAERYHWNWLAYCLMSNHVHFVIETPEMTLGCGMHRFATVYAQRFNNVHRIDGHLFQGRYGSKLVDTDIYFAQVLRYLAMNPVKAGLCADPREWRWSSHPRLLARRPEAERARTRIEELLDPWGGPPGARYPRLFDEGDPLSATLDAATERPPLEPLLAAEPRDEGIRAARRHGYTLAEIGATLGVHESTVSRWLSKTPST